MNVLDKSGSDWLVRIVGQTCKGLEMKGIVPMKILRSWPATKLGENCSLLYIVYSMNHKLSLYKQFLLSN